MPVMEISLSGIDDPMVQKVFGSGNITASLAVLDEHNLVATLARAEAMPKFVSRIKSQTGGLTSQADVKKFPGKMLSESQFLFLLSPHQLSEFVRHVAGVVP